jgi:hypothetical protein
LDISGNDIPPEHLDANAANGLLFPWVKTRPTW